MRYIDSGSRDKNQSLGKWISELDVESIESLRIQSGFFTEDSLPYLQPLLDELAIGNGVVRIVVGSNQGSTRRRDIEALIAAAGVDRAHLQLAILRYGNAFFHAKTLHTSFAGKEMAYVGSSNFTGPGVGALHVEAGLVLDTAEGDSASVLADIAGATDRWFTGSPPGLVHIDSTTDLDELVALGVIDVPVKAAVGRSGGATPASTAHTRLKVLFSGGSVRLTGASSLHLAEGFTEVTAEVTAPAVAQEWSKRLTRSDAQRKLSGNQRGSVALAKAGYPIKAQTWFRNSLFGPLLWTIDGTRTGGIKEVAELTASTSVLGVEVGQLRFPITHDPSRESGQNNYATLFHLGDLSEEFARVDFTHRTLTISRLDDSSFRVVIE